MGGLWAQYGQDIVGSVINDKSPSSLAINAAGDVIAIGDAGNDDNRFGSGLVRVYNLVGNTWIQKGSFIRGESATTYLGSDVSLSDDGNILAVGSPFDDPEGSVQVYGSLMQIGGPWAHAINVARERLGRTVSLSGDGSRIVVGSEAYLSGGGYDFGSAKVYDFVTGEWTQVGEAVQAVESFSGFV